MPVGCMRTCACANRQATAGDALAHKDTDQRFQINVYYITLLDATPGSGRLMRQDTEFELRVH